MSKDFVEQDADRAFNFMETFVDGSGTLGIEEGFLSRITKNLSKENRAKLVQIFDDGSYYDVDDIDDVVVAIEKFITFLIATNKIDISKKKEFSESSVDELVKKLSDMKAGSEMTFAFDRMSEIRGLKNHFMNLVRYLINLINNDLGDEEIGELMSSGFLDKFWVDPNKSDYFGYLPEKNKSNDEDGNDKGNLKNKTPTKKKTQADDYANFYDYINLLKTISSGIKFDVSQKRNTPIKLLREITRISKEYNIADLYTGMSIEDWYVSNKQSPKEYAINVKKMNRNGRQFFHIDSEFNYPDPLYKEKDGRKNIIDIFELIYNSSTSDGLKKVCFMPMVSEIYEMASLSTGKVNVKLDKDKRLIQVSYNIYDDSYDTDVGIGSSAIYKKLASCLDVIDRVAFSEDILREENGGFDSARTRSKWTSYLLRCYKNRLSTDTMRTPVSQEKETDKKDMSDEEIARRAATALFPNENKNTKIKRRINSD